MTILCGHGPAKQKRDNYRLRHGRLGREFNSFVAAPPPAPYTGPVNQVVTMVNNYQDGYAGWTGTGSRTRYYARTNQYGATQPLTVNYTTTTTVNNNWVINVNGYNYYSTQGTVGFLTDALTWDRWNQTYTMSVNSYAINGQVWSNWTGAVQTYDAVQMHREVTRRGLTYARPVETPEEREARRVREALALFQRVEAERLATQSAAERALGTLLGLLTAEQRDEYAQKGYFHVVGSRGRLYRIHKGSSGNIRRVISRDQEGKGEAAFCVHSKPRVDRMEELGLTSGHLPHEDHMIQQMLHLQIDEDEILAKANVHWGTREPTDAELERFFAAEEANQRDRERTALLL
jgi:hypothetical protein